MQHHGEFNRYHPAKEAAHSPFWNWLNLRRNGKLGHQDVEDIVLRFHSIEGKHDLIEYFDSMEVVDYFVRFLMPNCMQIVENFAKERKIGKVVVAKLKAGGVIPTHIDEGKYCAAHDRFHFVLTTNPDCYIEEDGVKHYLDAGTIWQLDNKKPHSVVNEGETDRIHIIADLLI